MKNLGSRHKLNNTKAEVPLHEGGVDSVVLYRKNQSHTPPKGSTVSWASTLHDLGDPVSQSALFVEFGPAALTIIIRHSHIYIDT